jgi:hypothetical protein
MTFAQWAASRRLPVKADTDGSEIVPGRSGSLWDYGHGMFGVSYEGTKAKWTVRRAKAKSLGLVVTQSGDEEGNMWFDPADKRQAAFAIQIAGVRPKRKASPKQLGNLARQRQKARLERQVNGV